MHYVKKLIVFRKFIKQCRISIFNIFFLCLWGWRTFFFLRINYGNQVIEVLLKLLNGYGFRFFLHKVYVDDVCVINFYPWPYCLFSSRAQGGYIPTFLFRFFCLFSPRNILIKENLKKWPPELYSICYP